MSKADQDRWDERYRTGSYAERTYPSPLLEAWLPALPRGRALDLACGRGRNAIFMAQAGRSVEAIDISPVGLGHARAAADRAGVSVDWRCADLDEVRLERDAYDLIVVSRYLYRERAGDLAAALRDGGALVYEQHVVSPLPVGGPGSERFRLQPNELLELFSGLQVIHYLEAVRDDPDGTPMALASLIARRASHPACDLTAPHRST